MAVSGKFNMYLNRKVDVDTLPIIDKNMMLGDLEMERRGWPDTVNEVKVIFPKMINNGQVYGTGWKYGGQWGLPYDGYGDYVDELQQNDRFTKPVAYLSSGDVHSVLILPEEKTVYGSGFNNRGQIGQGPDGAYSYSEYTRIDYSYGLAQDIIKAYAVGQCTFVINDQNRLFSTGKNDSGQLGVGDKVDRDYLTLVGTGFDSVGENGDESYHVICIKTDGTLWGMGYGYAGRLGTSNPDDILVPTQIGSASDWVQAAFSGNNSMVINDSNELWGTGLNQTGELGLGDTTTRYALTKVSGSDWAKISCGSYFAVAVKTDGTLWGTGSNDTGEIGLGTGVSYVTNFTQIGSDTDWADVCCGASHTIARKIDGSIWTTGYGFRGRLGLGDSNDRYEFERVGNLYGWTLITAGGSFTIAASERDQ